MKTKRDDIKRGLRRAERERLEKKRRGIYRSDHVPFVDGRIRDDQHLRNGELKPRPERVDTPTPCSCSMCGNPRRKMSEVTLAEIKADQDLKHQLREL